ncbi:MAG: hypothetical protein ACRD1T_09015 [Acidimicrobiia bacterium]
MQRSESRAALIILVWALIIQTAHMVEHVAQVVQKHVLMMERAQGFLGAVFDLEWVHFAYNSSLEVGFLAVLFLWRRADRTMIRPLLTLLVLFQGYHVVEHVVKMIQYYALGITMGPKGILGHVVPLIWLHFAFNLIVLALVVLVWDDTARAKPHPAGAIA